MAFHVIRNAVSNYFVGFHLSIAERNATRIRVFLRRSLMPLDGCHYYLSLSLYGEYVRRTICGHVKRFYRSQHATFKRSRRDCTVPFYSVCNPAKLIRYRFHYKLLFTNLLGVVLHTHIFVVANCLVCRLHRAGDKTMNI